MKSNNIVSKILIVDDQPENIQVLGSLLRQNNFIVGVAMNGKQALDTLNDNTSYDLVLLDVNMPELDGFEVCKLIRENPSLKDLPVIFLTAMVETEDIVKGFDAGGQDYLTKPFNSKELLARVNTQLELKQSRDKLKHVNRWLEGEVAKQTEELTEVNRKLLQLDKAKTDFLNIINHEIRTPLIGIKGVIGLIQYMECPSEVKELLDILDQSSARLEDFSFKALDITNLNTHGEKAIEWNFCDLAESISDCVYKHNDYAKSKNISFQINNVLESTFLKADRGYLDKCFSYIIDNAIKFGAEDSTIIIEIKEETNNFLITFDDEGDKFPENYDINKISPFSTDKHIDHNPALSLFLCKLIAEAHRGSIEVGNTIKGASVLIKLPKTEQ